MSGLEETCGRLVWKARDFVRLVWTSGDFVRLVWTSGDLSGAQTYYKTFYAPLRGGDFIYTYTFTSFL